jgi:polyisoprenoid-binding protein YceI
MKHRAFFIVAGCAVAIMAFGAPAQAAEYEVDGGHSSLVFKVMHKGASNVYGMIGGIEGSLTYDADSASGNAIEMTAKSASINTMQGGRDDHLKGPDFFNAREFPTMSFKSSKWEKTGDGSYAVTGDLTLLGVTKSVTAKVDHVATNEGGEDGALIGFEAAFTIDRTDFGMTYGVGGIGSEVSVIVSIEAGAGD